MRPKCIVAAAIVSIGVASASQAAEINEQGAKELRTALSHSLSRDLARSGFVSVKPSGDQYEITYDLAKFFDKINSSAFAITGFKPLTLMAQPAARGLWHIKGDNALDIAIHFPGFDASYSVASNAVDGILDPAIDVMRSLNSKSSGIKLSAANPGGMRGQVEADIDSSSISATATDGSAPGKIDMQSQGTLQGFREKVDFAVGHPGQISADSVDIKSATTGLPIKELRELTRFFVEHIKAKQLSSGGREKFAALVRRALPVFDTVDQTITFNNMQVVDDKGKVGAQTLTYSVKMDGITKASTAKLGLHAEHIALDPGMIPAGYNVFVPDVLNINLGVSGMNLAGFVDAALKMMVARPEPRAADALAKTIFSSGRATLDVPDISATSAVYDVQVSGSLTGSTAGKSEYSLQATILARNFDKTVAAIQDAAKTDPRLNSVSFGLLAAKGFAKTDPDGRLRWEVTVDTNRVVTVNGQVMQKL